MQIKIIGLFFRGLSLVSKFIALILLAKIWSVEDYGNFSLISLSISVLILLFGLEFYVFSTREYLQNKKPFEFVLKNQLLIQCVFLIVSIPIVLFLFYKKILPNRYIWYYIALLLCEFLANESFRMLIAKRCILASHICHFLRNGSWGLFVVGLIILNSWSPTVNEVLICWVVGCVLGFLTLFLYIDFKELWNSSINIKWISTGLSTSLKYLTGSLAFQLGLVVDKFFVKYYCGDSLLGVYTFYFTVCFGLYSLTHAAIFMPAIPAILISFDEKVKLRIQFKNLLISTIVLISLFLAGLLTFIQPLFNFVGKLKYFDNVNILYLMFSGLVFYIFGYVFHYFLYAAKFDEYLAKLSLLSLVISIILNLILIPKFGLYGATSTFIITSLFLLVAKYKKFQKAEILG